MKNILVSIDFEKESNLLVTKAGELATKFGSKLWIIHVLTPETDFSGYDGDHRSETESRKEELEERNKFVERYVQQLKNSGIDVEGLLVQGPIIDMILQKIETLNIDLVIIGHHKHSLFYKTFVGNTDTSLVNKSSIPVLLIPLKNDFIPETSSTTTNEELTIAF
jgi:nucleotide-binding universal stress UspA family protein